MCENYHFLVCESMLNIIANDNCSLSINQQFIHSSATLAEIERGRETIREREQGKRPLGMTINISDSSYCAVKTLTVACFLV